MTEFKIGDKVVVLTDSKGSVHDHGFEKGAVGEITGSYYEEDYCVSMKKEGVFLTQILHFSELELVNE